MSEEKILKEIREERKKQISKGYTLEHDIQNGSDITIAASCYLLPSSEKSSSCPPRNWPWKAEIWKPRSEREDLIVAAALIVARVKAIDEIWSREELARRVHCNLTQDIKNKLKNPKGRSIVGSKVCDSDANIYVIAEVGENVVVLCKKGRYHTFEKDHLYLLPAAWLGNEALYHHYNLIAKDGALYRIEHYPKEGSIILSCRNFTASYKDNIFLDLSLWSLPNE